MALRPAVVDTNVVVAGMLTADKGAPTARILDGMLAGSIPFLLSVELLAEYRAVLLRPAIQRRHGLSEDQVDRVLERIALEGMVREPRREVAAPDAGDQHIWDLVASHPTAVLVTGDGLLRKHAPPGRSVLSPAGFLGLIGESPSRTD